MNSASRWLLQVSKLKRIFTLKWGHEAVRGSKYKITNEGTSEQDSTHCSSFAIDAHPSSFKNYTSLSLQTPAQTLYFSQALLTRNLQPGFCSRLCWGRGVLTLRWLLPHRSPRTTSHSAVVQPLQSQRLNMDLSAGGFSKS